MILLASRKNCPRHPAIAQVYDAGIAGEDGMPYFAMELVEGARDFLRYAEEEDLSLEQRLRLFIRVCDAVQYGHQKGVIHRDLKPSNILVDRSGHPKIIDFGLARTLDHDTAVMRAGTRAGEVLGTLAYMSPEQLGGVPGDVDTRSDVYSLGVVLYELLTREQPYDVGSSGLPGMVESVRDAEPRRPANLPSDVTWALLKALEKEPRRRYASASELSADLERYLSNEPMLAGAPSAVYRPRKPSASATSCAAP
ncbi:MAG: serine/threonine protein kinase [bacterium]|nr:serine/threonine protein kinase [bacterium]